MEYNLEYGGVVVNLDKYQAKFPGKTPSWPTWAAFIAEAAALAEFDAAGKPCVNGLDIDPDWPEPARHILLSMILQRGGDYWSKTEPGLFDFNTPEARDSLAEMVKWVTVDKVMSPALMPDKNTYVTSRLAKGATGFGCGTDSAPPLSVMGYAGTWAVQARERPGAGRQHRPVRLLPAAAHGGKRAQVHPERWLCPRRAQDQPEPGGGLGRGPVAGAVARGDAEVGGHRGDAAGAEGERHADAAGQADPSAGQGAAAARAGALDGLHPVGARPRRCWGRWSATTSRP